MSATEWFRTAFGAHYLAIYAHRDEEEARQTVNLILSLTGLGAGAVVLDAPCGAGRHAREFRRRGLRVVGLDLSTHLLEEAVAQEEPASRLAYLRADLRAVPLKACAVDLVANLFSSFGYFHTDAENFLTLRGLVGVCKRGGHVVVDTMNAAHIRKSLQPYTERETVDGWKVREWRRIAGDRPRVEKRIRVEPCHGEAAESTESVRLFEPEEVEAAMVVAGLKILDRRGDYSGAPWSADSPRLIVVGERQW